jgi:hypothetical protein
MGAVLNDLHQCLVSRVLLIHHAFKKLLAGLLRIMPHIRWLKMHFRVLGQEVDAAPVCLLVRRGHHLLTAKFLSDHAVTEITPLYRVCKQH